MKFRVKNKKGRYLQGLGEDRVVTKSYFEKHLKPLGYIAEEIAPPKKIRKKREAGEPLENAKSSPKPDA